jgi:two-component system, sensor histidine kinase
MPKKTKSAGRKGPRRTTHRRPQPPSPARGRRRALEATLAALAHDIRTPLTGILALSELLETSGLGERERQWAHTIKSTAEHLAALTSLIVEAVVADQRRLALRHTLFDPRQLVDDLAASLAARAAEKGLTTAVAVADAFPVAVTGDPLRLRAALENLMDNAVKFTASGGIRFEVSAQNLSRARTRLVFAVADSGIGLTPAEIKRLFRPFTQANADIAARYGGAGLGLVFVKRIAKAMGGDLTVKSRPGRGSTFRLAVTVGRASDSDAPLPGKADIPGIAGRGLKVLCVEDNPYGRVVLNTVLAELGHRADFAVTGEAAIEATSAGHYDVVLMDMTLPGIGGPEAARRIHAVPGRPVPIIGISGSGGAEEEARARSAGMVDYLYKPLSPSALTRALAPITAAIS